jgi:nitrate/nitrite-specific signal transduction histidine kinase
LAAKRTTYQFWERAGHCGLRSIRKRAKLVGGQLEFWSEPDAGTEIELTISASIADAKNTSAPPFMVFE